MRFEDAATLASEVDGWLSPAEARTLYDLAERCSALGGIVEIGSWQGKSTTILAAGAAAGSGADVYAIDPHSGSHEHDRAGGLASSYELFLENIDRAGFSDAVTPIVARSCDALDEVPDPIGLVFIDGDHSVAGSRLDFDLWVPRIVEGGFVAIHDTVDWEGPRRLALSGIYRSGGFREAGFADSLVYGQRVTRATLIDRASNLRSLAAKLVYDHTRSLPLPRPVLRLGKRIVQAFGR